MSLKTLLAAAALVAAPAFADPIAYKVTGTFTGTLNSVAFSSDALLIGYGDTNTAYAPSNYVSVSLSSLRFIIGGATYTAQQQTEFFENFDHDVGGFYNDQTHADLFDFAMPPYSGTGYQGPTAATFASAGGGVQTDHGLLILNGGSNLSFSATAETSVSAAPEPASWGMFIGGFGLIGAAMRRKSVTKRFARRSAI